jgi:hypothetical protein
MALPKRTTTLLPFSPAVAVGARFVLSGHPVTAYAFICGVFVVLLGWTLAEDQT